MVLGIWLVAPLTGCNDSTGKDSADEPTGSIVTDPTETKTDTRTFTLDDTGFVLDDTGSDPFGGQDPTNTLTIEYSGYLDMIGSFPNYSGIDGEIHVRENVDHFSFDGEDKCYWIYLPRDGTPAPTDGCAECDFALELSFEIDPVPRDLDNNKLEIGTDTEFETALGECEEHDLPPTDGDTWILGFSSTTAYLNFGGSGYWIPWYTIEPDAVVSDRYLLEAEDNHYEWGFFYEFDTGMDN